MILGSDSLWKDSSGGNVAAEATARASADATLTTAAAGAQATANAAIPEPSTVGTAADDDVVYGRGTDGSGARFRRRLSAMAHKWLGGLTGEVARALSAHLADQAVSVKTFGAVGDGTSHPVSQWLSGGSRDRGFANLAAVQAVYPHVTALTNEIDWAAIQQGINYCKTNRRDLALGVGHFMTSDTLILTGAAFEGITVRGNGSGYSVSSNANSAETIIDHSAVLTKPGLAIGLARSVHLSGFALVGPNTAPTLVSEPTNLVIGICQGGSTSTSVIGAAYLNTCTVGWKFSIIAGTGAGQTRSVTSFNSTTKAIGMSALSVVPDTSTVYVLDDNAYLTAGVRDNRYSPQCGIAIDPWSGTAPSSASDAYPVSPTVGGGAAMTYLGGGSSGSAACSFENINIQNQNVGIIITPSPATLQGDTLRFRNMHLIGCKTPVALCQSQSNGVSFEGFDIEYARWGFDGTTYGAQQGTVPSARGGHFTNVHTGFVLNDSIKGGEVSDLYLESAKMLLAYGTGASATKHALLMAAVKFFTRSDWKLPPFLIENYGPVEAIACTLADAFDRFYALNAAGDGLLEFWGLSFNTQDVRKLFPFLSYDTAKPVIVHSARPSDNTTSPPIVGVHSPVVATLPNRVNTIRGARTLGDWNGNYLLDFGNYNTYESTNGTASGYVWTTPGQVTVAMTNTSRIQVGDLVFWQMCPVAPSTVQQMVPALLVSAVVANTSVTLTFLHDTDLYDRTFAPSTLAIATHEWAPGGSGLTATVTSGSPNLTGVSPTSVLRNGDWVQGAGIPSHCRVLSGQGTATIVLSANATSTPTPPVPIYYARVKLPTTTPAY